MLKNEDLESSAFNRDNNSVSNFKSSDENTVVPTGVKNEIVQDIIAQEKEELSKCAKFKNKINKNSLLVPIILSIVAVYYYYIFVR